MAQRQTGRNSSQSRGSAAHKNSSKKAKPAYGDRKQAAPAQAPLFDESTKRDIVGVILGILAVILFVIAIITPEGVVTSLLSNILHMSFGVGVYILPFLLLGVAFTFLFRFEKEKVSTRAAIGLCLIFVAMLSIVSVFTPGADTNPNLLFVEASLVARGGFLGAAISWACLKLFGLTVSVVLYVGLIVLAIVIIGFSFSAVIEKIRARRAGREEYQDSEEAGSGFTQMPFARIRRAPNDKAGSKKRIPNPFSNQETNVLPSDAPAEIASQDTQLLDAAESEPRKKRTPKASKLGAAASAVGAATGVAAASAAANQPTQTLGASVAEADTQLFAAGSKAASQPMTRKLGQKKTSEEKPRAAASATASNLPAPKKTPKTVGPKPLEGFELPDFSLLNTSPASKQSPEVEAALRETGALLEQTLIDFNVPASVVGWVAGPTVTLFKVDLPSGVRVSRVSNLTDDIALALAAPGVRIFAPIPGTNYVGIEVPNQIREAVLLGDVLKEAPEGPLQIAIGKDVEGDCIVSDLAKMPHLLIGGTTGSGKSVSINAMIMSILMRATPAEVRFIMIDPKRVEFTPYNGIPHLYVPVVTEPSEAASALSWGVAEMERRLKVFSGVGARNISQYNDKVQKGLEDSNGNPCEELPYIVIIIDELADLMMNVGKEVEFSISRLAQLARAAGIHLIVATQRPSTNVVTGLIKANITNRLSFNVASGIDSRVILDTPGAENLIGLGDCLLSKPELKKPQRIQGCYVSEDEISAVVDKLKEQGEPEYHNDILKTNLITLGNTMPDGSGGSSSGPDDPLVWEAAEIVCSTGVGSTSNLQRRLSVGYSRAGRIMDLLEEKGIVGPQNGSKPREVLVDSMELETIKAFELND